MDRSNLIIFICGTYADLLDERSSVIDALQKLHFRHSSMEFFGASPEAPIEVCLREVRQSDVSIVIVGHRYGTIVPRTDLSFTEAEYNEGIRLGKSCFVYIRDDRVLVMPEHVEQDPNKIARLHFFRQTLESRHTVFRFRNPAELSLQVTVDLTRSLTRINDLETAINIIRRGPDAWNAWRSANRGTEPQMDAVDLSFLRLEGIDLSKMLGGQRESGSVPFNESFVGRD